MTCHCQKICSVEAIMVYQLPIMLKILLWVCEFWAILWKYDIFAKIWAQIILLLKLKQFQVFKIAKLEFKVTVHYGLKCTQLWSLKLNWIIFPLFMLHCKLSALQYHLFLVKTNEFGKLRQNEVALFETKIGKHTNLSQIGHQFLRN